MSITLEDSFPIILAGLVFLSMLPVRRWISRQSKDTQKLIGSVSIAALVFMFLVSKKHHTPSLWLVIPLFAVMVGNLFRQEIRQALDRIGRALRR